MLSRIFFLLLLFRESNVFNITVAASGSIGTEVPLLNFMFASGNDFIYEFFNYDNFYIKPFSKKIFNYLNNKKLFNKLAVQYANKGLMI